MFAKKMLAGLVAGLLLAGLVAGCGDGELATASSSTSTSQADVSVGLPPVDDAPAEAAGNGFLRVAVTVEAQRAEVTTGFTVSVMIVGKEVSLSVTPVAIYQPGDTVNVDFPDIPLGKYEVRSWVLAATKTGSTVNIVDQPLKSVPPTTAIVNDSGRPDNEPDTVIPITVRLPEPRQTTRFEVAVEAETVDQNGRSAVMWLNLTSEDGSTTVYHASEVEIGHMVAIDRALEERTWQVRVNFLDAGGHFLEAWSGIVDTATQKTVALSVVVPEGTNLF